MLPWPTFALPRFPRPTLESPILPWPTFPLPTLPNPRLRIWVLLTKPATVAPTFPPPERLAGIESPSVLALTRPETVLPKLNPPEISSPKFWTPEIPELPEVRLKKPELLLPTLPTPDTVPVPALKNPDDGVVVEFPNPGAAGISMSGILIGNRPPVPAISISGSGPLPRLMPILGRTIEMFGKLNASSVAALNGMPIKKISPVISGNLKP
ncbi:Uncharacterised protein [Mycobacterium tuberculosis]|nr:Uncharacterised protein [Mycobacterium tuberculosis]COX40363.1 Uncharacterised protein [Mycobacterium tuberculosis]